MDNMVTTILPTPIIYATSFSIIVIALAILIWLLLTIIFGTMLLKKLNLLTKNLSKLSETLIEKSKQVADQTTDTIRSYTMPARPEKETTKKYNYNSVFNSIFGIGSMVFEVIKIVNLFKNRKEK